MLVWKTNTGDPYSHNYMEAMPVQGETYEQVFDSMIQGRPKATDVFTVEQLEDMGMIGLYAEE